MDLTVLEQEWLELTGWKPDHNFREGTYSKKDFNGYICDIEVMDVNDLLPSRNADACEKELEWLARKYRIQLANEANGDGTHGWVIFVFEKLKPEFIFVASHENNQRFVILEAGVKARRRNHEKI